MQNIMIDFMNLCGFNFEATTFPQLFQFMFVAICGTCLIACVIKIMLWITFSANKLFR